MGLKLDITPKIRIAYITQVSTFNFSSLFKNLAKQSEKESPFTSKALRLLLALQSVKRSTSQET